MAQRKLSQAAERELSRLTAIANQLKKPPVKKSHRLRLTPPPRTSAPGREYPQQGERVYIPDPATMPYAGGFRRTSRRAPGNTQPVGQQPEPTRSMFEDATPYVPKADRA